MKRLQDWYQHPKYYDAIFGDDTVGEMDFLLALNRRFGTSGRCFLEPACGAGRLIAEGTRRGLRMVGYDWSREMLAHARSRISLAEYRVHLYHARMESFAPAEWRGEVDLAYSLVSTFRYLDTEQAALRHLRCTKALLKPDGLYVLGFDLTDYARTKCEHERWIGKIGRDRVVCNTREWPPDRGRRRARMRNRLRITGPGKDWLIETEWIFRTYHDGQIDALLARAGFETLAVFGFDHQIDRPLPTDTDRLDRIFVLRPAPRAPAAGQPGGP
ncbi:MAG: class I SAM-dependent methyltransferase [Deltaproteobacteria bacterium]|nr:class I SAM-dependent methyltransferase [Deltaproteobacteria bacterium]